MLFKNRKLDIPIIQGGMGVGISLGGLAGSVAACGGMGVISAANPGYRAKDFDQNPWAVNLRELGAEIRKAKKRSEGKGLIGVNIMVAVNHYAELVQTCIKEKADAIISGAGLPLDLPKLAKGSDILLAPIVSSGKAARIICKNWDKKSQVVPDFVVIEGSEAGGHLGFEKEELVQGKAKSLMEILKEVLEELVPYEKKYETKIPVFVAGGVFDGYDLADYMKEGAAGAQIATRFIATEECDASEEYKQVFLDAGKEDLSIIKSPVGLPGRAINTPLIQKLSKGETIPPKKCMSCLQTCNPASTPYCISRALIEAAKGNYEEGLFFSGSNVGKLKEIKTVRAVMEEIMKQWRERQ